MSRTPNGCAARGAPRFAWCRIVAIAPTRWKDRQTLTLACGHVQQQDARTLTAASVVRCRQCSAGFALGRSDVKMGGGR